MAGSVRHHVVRQRRAVRHRLCARASARPGRQRQAVDSRVVLIANPVLSSDQRDKACAHSFASTNTAAQATAIGCHLNVNSVRPPTDGGVGRHASKDLIRGLGTNNWDISVFKNFTCRAKARYRCNTAWRCTTRSTTRNLPEWIRPRALTPTAIRSTRSLALRTPPTRGAS